MMPTTEWAIITGEWRYIVQAYLACVSFIDHCVGEVLLALEVSRYADNTIVVLWSDHGYHIGEKNRFGKHSLWEEATRAPLIISAPGFKGAQQCRKPVGMIDIYPTLLDPCGLSPHPQNEGPSLRLLLEDPNAPWPYVAITTYGRGNHAIRGELLRYIRYEGGSEELYDHRTDNDEWENLAGKDEYAEDQARLAGFLSRLNAPWAPASNYDYNRYFIEQRERESRQMHHRATHITVSLTTRRDFVRVRRSLDINRADDRAVVPDNSTCPGAWNAEQLLKPKSDMGNLRHERTVIP